MRKILLLLSLCGCTLVCAPRQAVAQPGDWTAVQGLAPGTMVKIRADHNSSTCSVTSVSDAELACTEGAQPRTFPRPEVRRVTLSGRGRSTLKGTLIGAGIGAAGGAILGAASTHSSDWFRGQAIAASSGIGLVIGGVTGALVGYNRNSAGHVIYQR